MIIAFLIGAFFSTATSMQCTYEKCKSDQFQGKACQVYKDLDALKQKKQSAPK